MQRSILLTLLTTSLVSAVSVPRVITPLRARISTSTTTSDTCDYVDLSTPVNVTGVNAHSVTVEACLCLSNIATYASELAATLGHSASQRANLTAALTTSLTNEVSSTFSACLDGTAIVLLILSCSFCLSDQGQLTTDVPLPSERHPSVSRFQPLLLPLPAQLQARK